MEEFYEKISKFLSFILTILLIVGNLPVLTQAAEYTVIDTFYLTVNTEAWTSYAIGYPEGVATAQLSMGVATGDEDKYSVRTNSSCLGVKTTDGYYQPFTSDNINLSALASGGTAPYTYKYVVRNVANNSWHTLKDYSSNSNYTVKLSSAGNKEFVVSVKDSKGNVVTSKRIQVTATN